MIMKNIEQLNHFGALHSSRRRDSARQRVERKLIAKIPDKSINFGMAHCVVDNTPGFRPSLT
jgi:hypothetical protein